MNSVADIHLSSRRCRVARAIGVAASVLALVASTFLMFPATAQEPPRSRGNVEAGGERHGPPPEALAACTALAAGSGCNFKHNGRDLKGLCWAPQGKPLACKPQGRSAEPVTGAAAPRR